MGSHVRVELDLRNAATRRCSRYLRFLPHLVGVTVAVPFFFFQAEDGIRDLTVTGVQTCALPICMPHFSGTAALALVRGRGLDVPFICVSGTISEEMAVAAMRAGANDWVTKGQLKRLIPAIERELRDAKGRAALRASETGYETLVEHAPVGIYRSNPEGRFLSVNAALVRVLGYNSAAELLQLDMARDVYADAAERRRLLDRDSYTDREYDEVEATWKRQDGRLLTVQLSVRAVRNADRQVEYYETFVRDVTEQRRLQQQLVQSQKMEAVGRLAGGVRSGERRGGEEGRSR